ncbi:UDP-glucose/GDP-mannose dehydrogenase family protein [Actinomadura sp. BRA 177]|uniref:UDP-glucose dehydrogenase family protein n=1 Tax=Actinomadura sp. BRA 177 TaxID=2745202 RepID=UPI001595C631|nr:UDP-glucose/GDP-mannose dehydrogenase family protein [Actinomadura sp. BRA 177]NVI91121.1 UDP-glucose/GDP-mannose dehydrogenase family protein [Actinomadura sp. BRA 177]
MTHRLTVIGTGYLGATHAACMADLGFEVLGLDVDAERIARLSAGDLPFYEPGLEPVLRRGLETGRLRFTTSYAEAAEFGDVHFVCVGTPQKAGEYAADLRYVDEAIATLAPLLQRPCLVVGKSTVPVGTAERLAETLSRVAPAGGDAVLAWNPEFLREGFAVQDTLHPDRIVAGLPAEQGAAEHAEKVLREIYRTMIAEGTPFITADFPTAELVKVSANAFLATKISFINAMAEVCEAAHADVTKLSEALSYDDRIGGKFLGPGLGFGGGCLPKDIRAFMARAGELGADQALTFLREVDEINIRRRIRMVDLARQLLGGSFVGRTVGVLGAAFKPNSDDVRDSPALDVAASIRAQGAKVTVYDPQAMRNARRAQPSLEYGDSALSAARDAHVVLLLTEWAEFRGMDPSALAEVVAERNIVDGRNALDPERWRAAGWNYRALGRP